MIGLYCSMPGLRQDVQSVLPPAVDVTVADDWPLLDCAGLQSPPSCWIVVAPWLFEVRERMLIRGFCTRFPFAGVVLVTSRDADNARLFKDLPVHEVIWLRD